MKAERFWQIWYYLAIVGIVLAGFIFVSNSTCIGEVSQRCGDINEAGIFLIIGLIAVNFYGAYRMYKYGNLLDPAPSLKFSWHGDRSFPISFIIFFTLAAVFLGEHLPVIIGFLGNHYNAYDSKPSMLDLGGLGDAGVVFVIYGVFGTILWALFRYFSWPVILLVGATLGGVAEVFLFINEQNPAEDAVNLANIVSTFIIWGGFISVIPQTIYQKIIRQWGRQGAIVAIVVVVLFNTLSVGFFAYQKYVLKRVNYSNTGLPVGVCPDRLVDEKSQPALAYWQGRTFNRVGKEAYDWVHANCPDVIERIEHPAMPDDASWQLGKGNVWVATGASPPCPEPIVLATPVDLSLVTAILYPGQPRDAEYKPHGGFRFDRQKDNRIEVKAPFDAQVVRGSHIVVNGENQYAFEFIAPCSIKYTFGHLLELDPNFQKIVDTLPANDERSPFATLTTPVSVKTGEIIATAVGYASTKNVFVDFGVYDLRQKNGFKLRTEWSKFSDQFDEYAVCWLDWLPPQDVSKVKTLPGADGINGRLSDYC